MGEIDRRYREAQTLITQLRDQAAVDTAALARWRALADALAADFASLRASMGFDEDNESLARYREATQQ